jgi:hypothetical protein
MYRIRITINGEEYLGVRTFGTMEEAYTWGKKNINNWTTWSVATAKMSKITVTLGDIR